MSRQASAVPLIEMCGVCDFRPCEADGTPVEGGVQMATRELEGVGRVVFFFSAEDPRLFKGPFTTEPQSNPVVDARACGNTLVAGREASLSGFGESTPVAGRIFGRFQKDEGVQQIGRNCLKGLQLVTGLTDEQRWELFITQPSPSE